jgi:hypothetical protein
MRTKSDFIIELLSHNNLSQKNRESLLRLASSEFDKNSSGYESIISKIESLQIDFQTEQKLLSKKIDQLLKNWTFSEEIETKNITNNLDVEAKVDVRQLIHKPKEITQFLKKFEENTALKFSTHIWDKTDFLSSYSNFIDKLNEEKRIYKFNDIFNYNRHLYNLLNYFLFSPKIPIEKYVPKYGWNHEDLKDVKIGWQFPEEILKKWSIKNFDSKTRPEDKKYPMNMEVPINFKPSHRIKNMEVNTFEDVVNIFKTEIQFRNDVDNLFTEVEFLMKKNKLTNIDSSINKLKKLHFYTYTKGVISAIDSIFRSFVEKNESFKDISFEVVSMENYIELEIIHLNSFPVSKQMQIDNPNKFFGGDSMSIINHLFSLCDYSIVTKFNSESNLEVEILYENVIGIPDGNNLKSFETKMRVFERNASEPKGYSHKLKFYV